MTPDHFKAIAAHLAWAHDRASIGVRKVIAAWLVDGATRAWLDDDKRGAAVLADYLLGLADSLTRSSATRRVRAAEKN